MDYRQMIEDDDEELSLADRTRASIPEISGDSPMPNMPRDPDDPREMLRKELERKYGNEQKMMSPEMRNADRDSRNVLLDNNRDLSFQRLLNNAASAAGTIGGKSAPTEGFDRFTGDLQKQNEAAYSGMMQDRKSMSDAEDRRIKLMEYLADRYGKDEALGAKIAQSNAAAQYRQGRDAKTDEYRNKMLDATKERTTAAADARQGAADDKAAGDLSKEIKGTQEIGNAIKNVENILGEPLDNYRIKEGVIYNSKNQPVDLPGVSTQIPMVGRITAPWGDARRLEGAISRVFNTELADRSGASVTNQEMERLKREFASGQYNTEAEMIEAMQAYKRALFRELKNREAGFNPRVKKLYESRGGETSATIGSGGQQNKQKTVIQNGHTYTLNEATGEYE